MLQSISTALTIAALAVVAIFAIQNLESTNVAFLGWSVGMPKIALILGCYFLGMLTGGTLIHWTKRSIKNSRRKSPEKAPAPVEEASA